MPITRQAENLVQISEFKKDFKNLEKNKKACNLCINYIFYVLIGVILVLLITFYVSFRGENGYFSIEEKNIKASLADGKALVRLQAIGSTQAIRWLVPQQDDVQVVGFPAKGVIELLFYSEGIYPVYAGTLEEPKRISCFVQITGGENEL